MANLAPLHGGNIYEAEKLSGRSLIDFSANINPLGLPLGVKRIISRNLDMILHYPDPGTKELTKRLADYWNISRENVLVGCGSVELIYLITAFYKPRNAFSLIPTFSEYERAVKSVGGSMRFLKLKEKEGFSFKFSDIPRTDMLFLCNPNNPSGNLTIKNRKGLKDLPSKLTVVDEAFMDFVQDEKRHTLVHAAKSNKKIIVLRTLTKFFALPGLRVGYLIAHKDIVKRLGERQMPWSVNALAQLAGIAVLNDQAYIKRTKVFIKRERSSLLKELKRIRGLKPYPSFANFILIKLENIRSSVLKKKLLKKGILLRDCANFRGLSDKFVRIAVRRRKENRKLLSALGKIL